LLLMLVIVWVMGGRISHLVKPPASGTRSYLRPTLRTVIAAACVIAIALIPFPRRLSVPMTVEPAGAQKIYVRTAGYLASHVNEGAKIAEGDPIAVLENPEVERELLARETRYESLLTQLATLQLNRRTDVVSSQRIPVVAEALQEAEKQLKLHRQRAQTLIIGSPIDGRVFAAEPRNEVHANDRLPRFWSGSPLDPINQNAWLEQGTVIGWVGEERKRDAIVTVPQDQIEFIRPGQPVSLLIASAPRESITGIVTSVADSPRDHDPAEPPTRPQSPQYLVRVAIDSKGFTLPVQMQGHARITVDNASVVERLGEFLANAFAVAI